MRIEAVVAPEVADRILAHLAATCFRDYSLVAYATLVEVVRSAKFT